MPFGQRRPVMETDTGRKAISIELDEDSRWLTRTWVFGISLLRLLRILSLLVVLLILLSVAATACTPNFSPGSEIRLKRFGMSRIVACASRAQQQKRSRRPSIRLGQNPAQIRDSYERWVGCQCLVVGSKTINRTEKNPRGEIFWRRTA